MNSALTKQLQPQIAALKVLVVDDDHHMRKVVRTMLTAIGVKAVFEACDGVAGLEAVRRLNPNLVIVDWEMPKVDGAQFVRTVRSPGIFPIPDVPIIMLSGHGDRWRVVEAARIGAHEYLLKPVSTRRCSTASSRSSANRARPCSSTATTVPCRAGWWCSTI